jgi:leader peptidase (prepilin peptidase) / N-methyltransferase
MDFLASIALNLEQLFSILASESWLLYSSVAVLGLVVGSFLNVVIYRLPIMMFNELRQQCHEYLSLGVESTKPQLSLTAPASHCPHCGRGLRVWHNIPVISYIFLAGKCAYCGGGISIRYPLIELIAAILAVLVAWQLGYGLPLLMALLFTWALLAASMIDIDHQLLPDQIILPLLWLGIGFNLFFVGFASLEDSVIGAMAGYLSLWLFYWIFKIITGKEGMGYGDFKLFAVAGAWLGWQALPMIILLSSLVGAIIGVALILTLGRDKNVPMPFGPFLAAATWVALLWGEQLQQFYFTLFMPTML